MTLFNKVFSTRTLLQIICVLGAVVAMKALSAHRDLSWAAALAAEWENSPDHRCAKHSNHIGSMLRPNFRSVLCKSRIAAELGGLEELCEAADGVGGHLQCDRLRHPQSGCYDPIDPSRSSELETS
jgi:hypothetical protein